MLFFSRSGGSIAARYSKRMIYVKPIAEGGVRGRGGMILRSLQRKDLMVLQAVEKIEVI